MNAAFQFQNQNDSQSGRDAVLLVAVITGYCISLTHVKLEVALYLDS